MNESFREIKSNSTPKILFLDQNQWIRLARVYHKKDNDPVLSRILQKILTLVEQGKIIVPLNLTTLVETGKRRDDGSRSRLAEFQTKVSGGYGFIFNTIIETIEIVNYFQRLANKTEIPMRFAVLTKGLSQFLGDGKIIVKNQSEQDKLKIEKIIKEFNESPQAVEQLLRTYFPSDDKSLAEDVKKQENIRKNQLLIEKNQRDLNILADHIKTTLTPKLAKVAMALGIHPFVVLPVMQNPEDVEKFIQQFPINYVLYCLSSGRDKDTSRRFSTHDLFDIFSLLIPIPYFDYVIGEKYFIGIAQRAKLGAIYGTMLLTKIEDIETELDKLNSNPFETQQLS